MGETQAVFSITVYFVAVTTLLQLSPIGAESQSFQLITGLSSESNTTLDSGACDGVACKVATFLVSTANLASCIGLNPFLCALPGHQPILIKAVVTHLAIIKDIINFAGSYAYFFFQLLSLQLPIPDILALLIVIPPAIAYTYIGLRFIRGGG